MRQLVHALVLAAAFGPFAAVGAAFAQSQTKVGVVDLQRAMNETEDGRQAKAKLKKVFEARQKTLDDQQNGLKAMKDNIEKQKDVLSRDVLGKKLEEYQKAFGELQGMYVEFQRELQAKEGELTKGIVDRLQRIVRRIGQKEGYTLVLDRAEGGVVYVPSTFDLTDVVIQRYNAGEGADDAPDAPAPKAANKSAK
jgi:outer membrane protein